MQKVEIFISWSGTASNVLAEKLRTWLPAVLQQVRPWISSADIRKGARGAAEIAKKLGEVNIGLVCLTATNQTNEWINFEAGAIAKNDQASLFTLLIDLGPENVKPPLGQFQHTRLLKEDVGKLLKDINALQVEPLDASTLGIVFEAHWPELERTVVELSSAVTNEAKDKRTDRDILVEILGAVRQSSNQGEGAVHRQDASKLEPVKKILEDMLSQEGVLTSLEVIDLGESFLVKFDDDPGSTFTKFTKKNKAQKVVQDLVRIHEQLIRE